MSHGQPQGIEDWVLGLGGYKKICSILFALYLLVYGMHQVRGGTNIFQGLITEVCRLPVHQETKLRFTASVDFFNFLFVKV